MAKQAKGLGKGLSALLGEASDITSLTRQPVGYVNKEIARPAESRVNLTPAESADIRRIPVDLIEPNPFQPRLSFDEEALHELAESIRTFGLIQPITVRLTGSGRYQIISGERRFRACRMTGMEMIPAYIREANDQGMLEMAIVENIQRENLDPIEVALSYRRLIDECNLTQEQMAVRVGRKRSSVTNFLRLLNLPAKIQHDLKVGLISVGHAKVILGVDDPAIQEQLCDLTVKNELSVRQLEEKVARLFSTPDDKSARSMQELPETYSRVLSHMGKFFSKDISLKRNASGKGSMTIRFESDAEIEKFLKALEDNNL